MPLTWPAAGRPSSPSASNPPSRPPATATSASARPCRRRQASSPTKPLFHRAEQFVEKPYFDKALEYLNSGQYRWNAGMFIWSFVTITEGLQKHQPEMYDACQRWFKVAATPAKLNKVLAKEYPELKKISIDYALMEHAHNVIVADGAFAWDDLGSWTALGRHLKADPEGNCAVADFIHVDGARNIIFDARSKDRRTPIAVVGLRDSILVQTDDATLLAHKEPGAEGQRTGQAARRRPETEEAGLTGNIVGYSAGGYCGGGSPADSITPGWPTKEEPGSIFSRRTLNRQ